jgi:hypothetical protein
MGGPFYWFDNDTRTRLDRPPWVPDPKPGDDDDDTDDG